VLRFEDAIAKIQSKTPTVLVADDDSPVMQDRLRRWQNANALDSLRQVERFAGVSFPF